MDASRWLDTLDLEGMSLGERRTVAELQRTRSALLEGQRELFRIGEDTVAAIHESSEDLIRANAASAELIGRELREIRSSLVDGVQTIEAALNGVQSAVLDSSTRLALAINSGFRSIAWRYDKLIQLSSRQSFALEHPRETEAREKVSSGLYAFKNGWWEDAAKDLAEACQVYRYDPVPWLYRGKLAFWIDGDKASADLYFSEAVRFGGPIEDAKPLVVEALLERARLAFLTEDRDSAATLAESAVKLDEKNPDVLLLAARFHVFANKNDAAVRYFVAAIDLTPELLLLIGSEWAAPIRRAMLDWAAKKHVHEIEPFRSTHERLQLLQSDFDGVGEFVLRGQIWDELEKEYTALLGGLLDLRRQGQNVRDKYIKAIGEAAASLERAVRSRQSVFEMKRVSSFEKTTTLPAHIKSLKSALSETAIAYEKQQKYMEEYKRTGSGNGAWLKQWGEDCEKKLNSISRDLRNSEIQLTQTEHWVEFEAKGEQEVFEREMITLRGLLSRLGGIGRDL